MSKRKCPEKHIEEWLSKHLHLFDPNLVFVGRQSRFSWKTDWGIAYVQIDILARDPDGTNVLIEVKTKATKFTANMQLRQYMSAWPNKNRGIVAAMSYSKSFFTSGIPSDVSFWRLEDFEGEINGTK